MEFNTEIRKKQLDNLDQLIATSRSRLQSVLSYLGWSEESVKKEDSLVQCPVNAHHRIDPKSWTEHIEKCVLKFEGYDQKSTFLSESLDNPSQSIFLDHNKKVETITKELSKRGPIRLAWNGIDPDPRTADRWITTYSPDERLIFYNYCVENTTGPPAPPEFTTIHDKKLDQDKPPSYEEILSQQRDAKRRRAKYKSVHINRKNHTEVIREVIDGQMDEYKEWLSAQEQTVTSNTEQCNNGNKNGNGVEHDKKEDNERPHSSISRTSNHSSSSRSTNKRYERPRNGERSRERQYNSRHYEQNYKREDRHRKVSPPRRTNEDRRHRSNRSTERRRSRERDRRDRSRERSNKRSYDRKR